MKTRIKNLFLLPALIAGLGLIPAGRVTAQTFTILHSFTEYSGSPDTNSDGALLEAGLILSGNTLYGTASYAGNFGAGTVFAVNTDGTGFTTLHSFTAYLAPFYTNSDGAYPEAGLILSGNTLYGTATVGGSSGAGTVFAININGTGFTNLHNFAGGSSDGSHPEAGLILSGNTLYGTASGGGSSGYGTVFKVNTDGTGFTNLHNFSGGGGGAGPLAGLILSGNTLYGTTSAGGGSGNGGYGDGTVFAVNTDGTGFTNLHSFTYSDGADLRAGLISSGNTLYGTAYEGGSLGAGAVFAIHTDGTGFTNVHSFNGGDGAYLEAGLILSGNTLYGAAEEGSSGCGTVFAVNTDGSGFTNLHNFSGNQADPHDSLILSGNTLYGTTHIGGSAGNGTVFKLSGIVNITNVSVPISISMYAGLTLTGSLGANYRIEYTYDLNTNWQTLTNITLPASPHLVIDTDSPFTVRRFYRATLVP